MTIQVFLSSKPCLCNPQSTASSGGHWREHDWPWLFIRQPVITTQALALIYVNRFQMWSPQQGHCFHTKILWACKTTWACSIRSQGWDTVSVSRKPSRRLWHTLKMENNCSKCEGWTHERSICVWPSGPCRMVRIIKQGDTLLPKHTHIHTHLFNFSSHWKWGYTKEMRIYVWWNATVSLEARPHISGNSGIAQLWSNVKILLWSSLTAWRLCYQWCITWFGFLSGCCDKILWQKATIERKSRQWESEVAAHMTSTAKSREQWANNVCTLVLSSLSTLLCNPGYSTQRMEPPTVGRFSHWWRLSRPTEFKQSLTETLFPQ